MALDARLVAQYLQSCHHLGESAFIDKFLWTANHYQFDEMLGQAAVQLKYRQQ